MLPPLEVTARLRPLDLVSPATCQERVPTDATARFAAPRPAPYAALEAELGTLDPGASRLELAMGSGPVRLGCWYEPQTGEVGLEVTDSRGRSTTHRSRRHGRVEQPPSALALTLTGLHLTLFCRDGDRWTARARVDLTGRVDTHDEEWLAGLWMEHRSESALVSRIRSGGFGHLGLRDLRLVTEADGRAVRRDGDWLLTATSAGPGFFDTAHTSLWRLSSDLTTLTHGADLYFRRPERPGVYGDHAVHLVRDDDRWLLATSTWGDFDPEKNPTVAVTLAEVPVEGGTDVLRGEHVLDTRALPLPTDGFSSVGVWDPHLMRDGDSWLVGYASARKFFKFHPCVASGPTLDELSLRAAATDRRATEGVTLARLDGVVRVLASDGRDSRRDLRARYPVLDLDLAEIGTLDAPYPSNLPWPTLLHDEDGWSMVTFDGERTGGPLLGYGTHGAVVIMREDVMRERARPL